MCGIFGYTGVNDSEARFQLVAALGYGSDSRGNSAAGFVSLDNGNVIFDRKIKGWRVASQEFFGAAASGETCMAHSRAPFGLQTDAHPFPITRNGEVVLWGLHNGGIYDAYDSADNHGRKITVDSMEIFELLGDNDLNAIRALHGWGVITWVEAANKNQVKLARISRHTDLVAVTLEEGGTVWASTLNMIKYALNASNLNLKNHIDVSEVGRVYIAEGGVIYPSDLIDMKVNDNFNC